MSHEYIVLNEAVSKDETVAKKDPLLIAKNLQSLMLRLKGLNLVDEKSIDYKNLIENDIFKNEYLNLAKELNFIDLDQLYGNDSNLMAFFLNIYNALTIHGISHLVGTGENLASTNLLDQIGGKFWSKIAYKIDKYAFSLDDIEHGILRANRPHPSRNEPLFKQGDERLKFCLKKFDPRIHFALNCGAKGCPAISFYSPSNLDRGLEMAAVNFCTNETSTDLDKKCIRFSRLFLWYKSDFICQDAEFEKKNDDELLIKFIGNYLRDKEQYTELVSRNSLADIKVEFSSYDWSINFKN